MFKGFGEFESGYTTGSIVIPDLLGNIRVFESALTTVPSNVLTGFEALESGCIISICGVLVRAFEGSHTPVPLYILARVERLKGGRTAQTLSDYYWGEGRTAEAIAIPKSWGFSNLNWWFLVLHRYLSRNLSSTF